MNLELRENPQWAGVALDDLLEVAFDKADCDDFCGIEGDLTSYIKTMEGFVKNTTHDLCLNVLSDFLVYTQHCNQVYRQRFTDEQDSDDEVFVTPNKTEDIKEQNETTELFPEHLIAIVNS